jgi:uncharacterized membrane protein required for colicin V production
MFTQFDTMVAVGAFIFMTLGFFKGAIRSILGLGKWYGAGVLTLLFYPKASEMVASYMQPGMIANGVAVFATYIVALIILSIIIGILVAALGATVGGPGDRFLGALVGLTIGVIIASTAHYFIRSFAGGEDPQWLKDGKTYSVTAQGADTLQGYFKDVVKNMGTDMGFVKDLDPSGQLMNQIEQIQNSGTSQIDFEKLKEAIRIMKEEGSTPEQIKDMINIQDYMITPQETINSATGAANTIVNEGLNQVNQLKGALPQAPVATDDQE